MEHDEYELVKKDLFLEILKKGRISTLFQPIISLKDGSVCGYEALSRGPIDTDLFMPDALFGYAEEQHALWELELLCRTKALEKYHDMHLDGRLFLNVSPNIMHDKAFQKGMTIEYLNSLSIDSGDIVFEITEKQAIINLSEFIAAINHYKNQNYLIAIDDAGAGFSGLNLISDIRPHFIKLDMKLIRNINEDPNKKALIQSMRDFANITQTHLVAEGIETEGELRTLIEIGVEYGQGYLIQKPNELIQEINDDLMRLMKQIYEENVMKIIHYEDIAKDPEINEYITSGNRVIGVLGYTDHSQAHAAKVAEGAAMILTELGYSERETELAKIAGYMHDIGNSVNRTDHAHNGALLSRQILKEKGMDFSEIATIMAAIGNHDERSGTASDPVSAALILADKSDVRRNRVRNKNKENFDIHDRVNYAAIRTFLHVDKTKGVIHLEITLDETICSVLDYFEIFLQRMLMCRRAAEILNCKFKMTANDNKVI